MIADWDRRRRSFDTAAREYEAARPGYPERLFDDLVSLSGVEPGTRVLEIACGTGKATRSLVARGLRVTAVELGASLAEIAREVIGPDLDVHIGRFEDWDPPAGASFPLAVCAQAYHWLDPEIANPKLARLLAPGAPFAAFWNVDVDRFGWKDAIYEAIAPELDHHGDFPEMEERVEQQRADLERGGILRVDEIRRYPWTMKKSSAEYIRLIDTYSEHRTLPPEIQRQLYTSIEAAIDARGGTITREVVAYVLLARAVS